MSGLALLGNFVRRRRTGPGMMDLLPAIDLRGGRAVRLLQGDYDRETVYGDDPVAIAVSFADAGARWIHVVDLDAARSGEPVNRAVIGAICEAVSGRARVQTGGGVRTVADAAQLRITRRGPGGHGIGRGGASRTGARRSPGSCRSRSGSTTATARSPSTAGRPDRGSPRRRARRPTPMLSAFVITNIARDGMLTGPDVEGLAAAAKRTSIPVIASGGIASLDDLVTLVVGAGRQRGDHGQGALRRSLHASPRRCEP